MQKERGCCELTPLLRRFIAEKKVLHRRKGFIVNLYNMNIAKIFFTDSELGGKAFSCLTATMVKINHAFTLGLYVATNQGSDMVIAVAK